MGTQDRLDDRVNLLAKMIIATDTNDSKACGLGKLGKFNNLVKNCLNCQSSEDCIIWLEQYPISANAPSFCPNAKLLNKE